MVTNEDDRARKYAEALAEATVCCGGDQCPECFAGARAVMAVADAEQAELVARVAALLDEGEMIWPDAPEWAVDGVCEFTERIRAALKGAE